MMDLKIAESYVLLMLNSKQNLNFHETFKILCFYTGAIFDLEESGAISEVDGIAKTAKLIPDDIKYLNPIYKYVKSNENNFKKVINNFSFNFQLDTHQKIWGNLLKILEEEKAISLISVQNLDWNVNDLYIKKIIFRLKIKLLMSTYYDEFSIIIAYMMKNNNLLKDYFTNYEIVKINKIIAKLKTEDKLFPYQIFSLKFIKIIDTAKESLNKNSKIKN